MKANKRRNPIAAAVTHIRVKIVPNRQKSVPKKKDIQEWTN